MISEEIRAAQEAYAARPFAVRWCDSHCSGTFRFHTYADAFDYVQEQWARIRRYADTKPYPVESLLWQSRLITPDGSVSLRYVLLCDDVSSYRSPRFQDYGTCKPR